MPSQNFYDSGKENYGKEDDYGTADMLAAESSFWLNTSQAMC